MDCGNQTDKNIEFLMKISIILSLFKTAPFQRRLNQLMYLTAFLR